MYLPALSVYLIGKWLGVYNKSLNSMHLCPKNSTRLCYTNSAFLDNFHYMSLPIPNTSIMGDAPQSTKKQQSIFLSLEGGPFE